MLYQLSFPTKSIAFPNTILILGDSLSAGYKLPLEKSWVSLLESKLQNIDPILKVYNSSISGSTSREGVSRLPNAIEKFQPDLIIIALGSNDGLRGLPISQLKINLSKMIKIAKDKKIEVLLLPFMMPANLGPIYQKQFNESFKKVADQEQVTLGPFILENIILNPNLLLEDNIHPNIQAQPLILETLWPSIASKLNLSRRKHAT